MLPSSFTKAGLLPASQARRTRRLMIGSEGLTNTGKTEFFLSFPGPKVLLVIDRGYDSALDNPTPPASRNLEDCAIKVIAAPKETAANKSKFVDYFKLIRSTISDYLDLPELVSICIDGDTDFWELQLLAQFERLQMIHPLQYTPEYAARKAMTARWWDSGKIILATNKLKDKYEDIINPETGLAVLDDKGKAKQRKVAGEYKRQGDPNQDYLWQLQLRHLYKPGVSKVVEKGPLAGKVVGKSAPVWGLRITKCKANPQLEGDELWGSECNFAGLVQHVYPQVPLEDWGFKS